MNCPEKINNFFLTHHTPGGGGVGQKKLHAHTHKSTHAHTHTCTHTRGVKIKKVREISRTAEKIDKTNSAEKNNNKRLSPTHPTTSDGGGGGRGENFKVTRHKVLKSISGMQLSWAKPGNPREGG